VRRACLREEWNEAKEVVEGMRGNLLVDARNIYRSANTQAAGFRYLGVGRPQEALRQTDRTP
jgi:hypothetical protein